MPGFYNPIWLLGLITIPIVYYLYHLATKTKKLEAMKFSQIAILQTALGNTKKSRRPQILLILALLVSKRWEELVSCESVYCVWKGKHCLDGSISSEDPVDLIRRNSVDTGCLDGFFCEARLF